MIHGHIVIRKKSGVDGPKFPVKKTVKIGSGIHCDVRIHIPTVSETHCLILVENNKRAMIQNLSLTSQTWVNAVPIGKGTCALKHGDTCTVGKKSFRWFYGPQTPFYERKRGKSEGSQNIAVVNPLFHKRRTIGSHILLSESSKRTPRKSLKAGTPGDLKGADQKSKSPSVGRLSLTKTPKSRLSAIKAQTSKTPKTKSPSRRSVSFESSENLTPAGLSHSKSPANLSRKTSLLKTHGAKSPVKKSPVLKTSARKSVTGSPKHLSPAKSPAAKSPMKSPVGRTSLAKSPAARTSLAKNPAKSPMKSLSETPAKSPAAKSPMKSPAAKISVKTPAKRTPRAKTPSKSSAVKSSDGSKRKSKSAAKSVVKTKGQKRRLSSPAPVASKRLKIESPKSIDKKKMAVLMGIHGRSSTLSTVKVVLSAKKTPIVKAIKTPRSSTVKKNTVKSSVKKPRRPLFSDILKRKAVQTANTAAKKLTLPPRPLAKPQVKDVEKSTLSLEIPQKFKFGSTGHANSPEPIFIGRKVAKTPVVTKRGRKAPLLLAKAVKGNMDLSGISEMFKTPAKSESMHSASPEKNVNSTKGRQSRSSTPPILSSPSSSQVSRRSRKSSSSAETEVSVHSPPRTPNIVLKLSQSLSSSVKGKHTPVKSMSPQKTLAQSLSPQSTLSNAKASSSSQNRSSASSSEFAEERSSVRTPHSVSRSVGRIILSGSKRSHSLMTSTPAALLKRQSFAGSAFESPSSELTGQVSTPQSPVSGRKSRLDIRTPFTHSPNASPVKSSLKSSPPKSPEKQLSVSFNDSIHIKMLVPGSRKSLSTTAPLSSPASPQSEGGSGIATPDLTTFDFNSIKTPNVPREMFVSSILSSGGSSNCSKAAGSAKRKGKTSKSSHNNLSNLQGVKRLMKTPTSPAGYVDVKGIKRLMTAAGRTPTYLAVEGVKKLFGDAAAAAGNELASFPGVRELFASPSPPKTKRRVSPNSSPERSPQRSPVAKIQAEVESKGRSSTESAHHTSALSPGVSVKNSPVKSPASNTPMTRGRKVSRKRTNSSASSATPVVPEYSVKPKKGRAAAKKEEPAKSTPTLRETPEKKREASPVKVVATRRGRKTGKAPLLEQTVPKSPVVESPPKRRTRAIKVSSVISPKKSPVKPKRAAAKKTVVPETSASPVISPKKSPVKPKRAAAKKTAVPETSGSPVLSPQKSPVKPKRAAAKKTVVPETSASPVISLKKSPVKPKRAAAKKPAVPETSPAKALPAKRTTRRGKEAVVAETSPAKASPAKRSTRRGAKVTASPKTKPTDGAPSPAKATPSSRKRKAVTFEDDKVTPAKKGKSTASKTLETSPEDAVVPEKKLRTHRVPSIKNQQESKEPSPSKKSKTSKKTSSSPKQAVSPRKTRSRRK